MSANSIAHIEHNPSLTWILPWHRSSFKKISSRPRRHQPWFWNDWFVYDWWKRIGQVVELKGFLTLRVTSTQYLYTYTYIPSQVRFLNINFPSIAEFIHQKSYCRSDKPSTPSMEDNSFLTTFLSIYLEERPVVWRGFCPLCWTKTNVGASHNPGRLRTLVWSSSSQHFRFGSWWAVHLFVYIVFYSKTGRIQHLNFLLWAD